MIFRRGRTVVFERKVGDNDIGWCGTLILFIFGTLFFVGIPLYAYSCENELHEMTLAFLEAEEKCVSLPSDRKPQPHHAGELLHLQSDSIHPDSTITDPEFHLQSPKALKMVRNTEYCQWEEIVTETTTRDGEKETVVRTYNYLKGWHPFRIPSTFFDQPFKYHNPMRDPFPKHHWEVESASFGDYKLDSDVVHSITNFHTKMWTPDDINEASFSPAANENFRYLGNGYFYSAYETHQGEMLAKLAGQFLEGSLLDFQIVDLLPQCTAGDIRVHFTTVEPREATVMGLQKDGAGTIGGWRSSRGYVVALLEEGRYSATELLDLVRQRYLHWTVWVARSLLILWSVVIIFLCAPNIKGFLAFSTASVAFALGALGGIWFIVNPSLFSFILLVSFVVEVFALSKFAKTSPSRFSSTINSRK